MVQIRLCCLKGLFKGCLLATSDTSLCPSNCIVLRQSMKKANSVGDNSNINVHTTSTVYSLDVVNTFESVGSHIEDGSNSQVHLNAELCLLLQGLGVPDLIFINAMEDELSRIRTVLTDRQAAYNLVKRSIIPIIPSSILSISPSSPTFSAVKSSSEDVSSESDTIHDMHAGGGDVRDNRIGMTGDGVDGMQHERYDEYDDVSRYIDGDDNQGEEPESGTTVITKLSKGVFKSAAYETLEFLRNGHDLNEPKLEKLLKHLQRQQYNKLSKFKMRMDYMVYLVGAPDPYGVLLPNEVFVVLPRSSLCQPVNVITGSSLVTRFPMKYPSDIRRLEAVSNDKLLDLMQHSCSGVILFSILGKRSAADEMSGGDFDGDQYLVMYGKNLFIDHVKPVDPMAVEDALARYHITSLTKNMSLETSSLSSSSSSSSASSVSLAISNEAKQSSPHAHHQQALSSSKDRGDVVGYRMLIGSYACILHPSSWYCYVHMITPSYPIAILIILGNLIGILPLYICMSR